MLARPPARQLVVAAAAWGGLGHRNHPKRLFVFGLGYTGLGAATYFQERGWSVAGTCRTEEKCQKLGELGIATYHFDPADYDNLSGKALDSLRSATHVLSTVPPDADAGAAQHHEGDPVIQAHAQLLSERAEEFEWVGYISSTSVYGDYGGEWVDEGSELRAARGKGWARVLAEHEWLALHDTFGLPVHIFRCGGIYGPRRSALETLARQQLAAASGGSGGMEGSAGDESASQRRRRRQRFTARCHVLDICQVLEASMARPRPGASYNIADDEPADRATVMAYAAELLQQKAAGLPLGEGAGGSGSRSCGSSSSSSGGWWWGGGSMSGVGCIAGPAVAAASTSSIATSVSSTDSYESSGEEHLAVPWQLRPVRPLAAGPYGTAAGTSSRRQHVSGAVGAGGGGGSSSSSSSPQLDEKRVSNERIKKELGVRLEFPTYRQGLAAIAAGDMRPFN